MLQPMVVDDSVLPHSVVMSRCNAQSIAFKSWANWGRTLLAFLFLSCRLGAQAREAVNEERFEAGRVIYANQCADCHGSGGQGGTDAYQDPLVGDRSLKSLVRRIVRTMPEEDPDLCVGQEASDVAYYVYHAFYSSEARAAMGRAPRMTPARLTAEQFQNAVADLVSYFTPHQKKPAGHDHLLIASAQTDTGLRATYFQSKGMNKANEQKLERVDQVIEFDFGEEGPTPEIDGEQFAIIWEGGFLAQTSGDYTFRVTSENGARLYVNHDPGAQRGKLRDDSSVAGQAALIDGWVSSGAMRSMEAKVQLIGGRSYPLRLEFFKYKEKSGSIRLEWKAPHGVWKTVHEEVLRTHRPPRTFVLQTPFPADDRSLGYERGSDLSYDWYEAVIQASAEVAQEVVERLPLLVGFKAGDEQRQKPIQNFLPRLAEHAFGRPLDADEQMLYEHRLFETSDRPESAVRKGVMLMVTSPSFLYAPWGVTSDKPASYLMAARLARLLWDSLPDAALLQAASEQDLLSTDKLQEQIARMVDHPLTRFKMRSFFEHWLELEERDLSKDAALFPGFTPSLMWALRQSLDLFIDRVVWSDTSDYRDLLLADYLLFSPEMVEFYLMQSEEGFMVESVTEEPTLKDWVRVQIKDRRRSGVLTHPYLLSAFAYPNSSSPIHRGVFMTRQVVGREMKPPPVAVAFNEDDFEAHVTMREKVTQLTQDAACMACHGVINALGFPLEHYDAVGKWRTHEKDTPIDARSIYETDEGVAFSFSSAWDVAQHAIGEEQAHNAFVASLFHQFVKWDPAAFDANGLQQLRLHFQKNQFNVKGLLQEIAHLVVPYGIHEQPSVSP